MCGITGIIKFRTNVDSSEIKSMTDAIAHRGPDGEGIYLQNNIAIGHRRLSIIDLDGGHQPMCDTEKKIWITFNGEIYNYKKLRSYFESEGIKFKTKSDTEVIIHAYKKWGDDCVNHLRGMFAFCILDYTLKQLFLVRDPFGIKPLVYYLNSNFFAFASEIKALKKLKDFDSRIKLDSIEYFLRYQYIPSPDSIFEKVIKLKPGHLMKVSFDGTIEKPKRYWEFKFDPSKPTGYDIWKHNTHKAINETIKTHLVSDVPFGVFLSGGIDSTLVASKMYNLLETPVKAFTIGFTEEKYSELKYAKHAADKIGFHLEYEILNKDHYKNLDKIINQYDEPYGDFSSVPTYYVSKLARQHVPMVLSGDGPDELFGGYGRYLGWGLNTPLNRIKHELKNGRLLSCFTKALKYSISKFKYGEFRSIDDWWEYIYFTNDNCRKELWINKYKFLQNLKNNSFLEVRKRGVGLGHLEFAQHLDINTYLCDDILTKVDIASMAHGLEVRPPFLDTTFADMAMNMPTDYKFASNLKTGKYILKDILGDRFSNEFVYRKKMGFGIPKEIWFSKGGFLRKMILEYIEDENNFTFELMNRNKVISLVNEHNIKNDLSNELWLLLVLLIWFDNNKEITL